jgi:amino acid adenylation domain-containing protein
VDPSVPAAMQDLSLEILRFAHGKPSDVAIMAPGREALDYERLWRIAGELARFLVLRGLRRGDAVAIVMPDGPEQVMAFLAVAQVAVCAPLNPAFRAPEFEFTLADLRAQALIVQAGTDSPAVSVAQRMGIEVIEALPDERGPAGALTFKSCGEGRKTEEPSYPDDTALVLHTSATTGQPKLVPLTHGQLTAMVAVSRQALPEADAGRVLIITPQFHLQCIMSYLVQLFSGGTSICTAGFRPDRFLEWMETFAPTHYTANPTLHRAILSLCPPGEPQAALRSLRFVTSLGALLTPELQEELERSLGVPVSNGYGLTEAGRVTMTSLDPARRKPGSVGTCVGPDTVILGKDGEILTPGCEGEIALRGATVISGYAHNPEANRSAFLNGWFRTGDLGVLDQDGFLFVTGRLKEMINRGAEKILPYEVEAVLSRHPMVAEAAVFGFPHPRLGEDIAAVVVLRPEAAMGEVDLRRFAAESLADFKVPRRVLFVADIPKGRTGKYQRARLAEMLGLTDGIPRKPDASAAGPQDPLQDRVARIWADLLKVQKVSDTDDFIALGGDSLLALTMLGHVEEACGCELEPGVLAIATNFAQFLAAVREAPKKNGFAQAVPERKPLPAGVGHTASLGQEALWCLDQTLPEPSALNLLFALKLKGHLRPTELRESLQRVLQRHEILRSRFRWQGEGLLQVVDTELSVDLPCTDLSLLTTPRILETIVEVNRPRYDLAAGPLLRALLIKRAPEDYVLALSCHHTIFDAKSMHVLLAEWRTVYRALCLGEEPSLGPLSTPFRDHARRQRDRLAGEASHRHVEYWKHHLAGAPPLLELPTDRPRPREQGFEGGRVPIRIPAQLVLDLKAFAHNGGGTLSMTLLMGYQLLLGRLADQDDVVVGVSVPGRPDTDSGEQIGPFDNTLALRADLSGNPTVRECFQRVRQAALGGFAHQELPFEAVVAAVHPPRKLGHSPIFQAAFVLHEGPRDAGRFLDLEEGWEAVDSGLTLFDLTLELLELEAGMEGGLKYRADLFDMATVERFATRYLRVLEAVVADPDQRISRLPVVSPPEGSQLFEWGTGSVRTLPDEAVHAPFERQAALQPSTIAVTFRERHLTYGELDRLSRSVASSLRARGVGRGTPVGLFLEPGLEQVVGMLGVLRAGGAYVPMDPSEPGERVRFLFEDTQARWVLTQAALLSAIPPVDATALFVDLPALAAEEAAGQADSVSGDYPACILYTSDSAGAAKGVVVTHRNLTNGMAFLEALLGVGPGDRCVGLTPLGSGVAAMERLSPLRTGAQLTIIDKAVAANAIALTRVVERLAPTVFSAPTATWQLLAKAGWQGDGHVKLICSGDILHDLLAKFLLTQGREVWSIYGTAETTVMSTIHSVRAEALPGISLGRPGWNTRVMILDAEFQPVPPGVRGEIWIGGEGVSQDYLHQEAESRSRFISDPGQPGERLHRTGDLGRWRPDGTLAYLGRMDSHGKPCGCFPEREDSEAVLWRHPDIQQVAVAVRRDGPVSRLVAFVVPSKRVSASPQVLSAYLEEQLPAQQVPVQFLFIDQLPRRNGKVAHSSLQNVPLPEAVGQRILVAPRDPTEALLAEIWEELLDRAPISMLDNFFDLGGHSLLAARLMARIEAVCGRRLPMSALLQGGTIDALGQALQEDAPDSGDASWTQVQAGQGDRTLFFLHGDFLGGGLYCRKLASHLGDARPLVMIHPHGLGGQPLATTLEAMAANHVALIRRLQPCGPYLLGGYCNGGLEALEMARQLRVVGEEVELVIVVAPPSRTMLENHSPFPAPPADWGSLALVARRYSAMHGCFNALAKHVYQVYDGTVAMLLPEDTSRSDPDATLGWGSLLPRLRIHPLFGSHESCLIDPALGAQMRVCLQQNATVDP